MVELKTDCQTDSFPLQTEETLFQFLLSFLPGDEKPDLSKTSCGQSVFPIWLYISSGWLCRWHGVVRHGLGLLILLNLLFS